MRSLVAVSLLGGLLVTVALVDGCGGVSRTIDNTQSHQGGSSAEAGQSDGGMGLGGGSPPAGGGDGAPLAGEGGVDCFGGAPGCAVATELELVSVSPQDAATNVARGSLIVAKFSAPVAPASVTADTFQVSSGAAAVDGTFTVKGDTVKFTPKLGLLPAFSQVSVALLAGGVKSVDQGRLKAPFSASFTTQDGAWGNAARVKDATGGAVARIKVLPLPDGSALAVWARMSGPTVIGSLWSSTYSEASGWGAPVQVDKKDGALTSYTADSFAIDSNGNALVGWVQNKNVRAAYYAVGAGWNSPIDVQADTQGTAVTGGIGFDASGNAFAVWTQTGATYVDVWGARYDHAAGFGAIETLDVSNGKAEDPAVTVSSSGNAFATWRQDGKVWGSYYAKAWQDAKAAPTGAGTVLQRPRPAFLTSKDAVVVWEHFPGSGAPQVWSATYLGATGWQQPAQLPVPQPNTLDSETPTVAAAESGSALTLWSDVSETLMWGNQYAAGAWTTGKQLAGNPGTVFASLSAEPSGNGMSAWTEVAKHVVVRRFKADGGWGPPRISTPQRMTATPAPSSAQTAAARLGSLGTTRAKAGPRFFNDRARALAQRAKQQQAGALHDTARLSRGACRPAQRCGRSPRGPAARADSR